jgi:hypothetical protein
MSVATSKVPVPCPKCGKQLMVPLAAAGKQGRCPGCTHVFTLPALLEAPESDELPRLAPLESDLFGRGVPTSGYQLPQSAPQGNYAPPAAYGSAPAQQPYPYAEPQPVNPYMATAYAEAAQKPHNPQKYNHAFGLEQRGLDAGMMGGLLMMVIGAVWLVVGLYFGLLFWYAPILCIIGLVGFLRGLFTGNVAGGGD